MLLLLLLTLLKVGMSCYGRDLVYYLLMIDSFIVFCSCPFHHAGWRETKERKVLVITNRPLTERGNKYRISKPFSEDGPNGRKKRQVSSLRECTQSRKWWRRKGRRYNRCSLLSTGSIPIMHEHTITYNQSRHDMPYGNPNGNSNIPLWIGPHREVGPNDMHGHNAQTLKSDEDENRNLRACGNVVVCAVSSGCQGDQCTTHESCQTRRFR